MRTVALSTVIGQIEFGRDIGKLPERHRFVWDSCEICGKERWVMLVKGMPQRMRCFRCRKPRTQLPRPTATCLNCGYEFTNRQLKHNLEHGWGMFCSLSCGMVWKRKQGLFKRSPNNVESMLANLINTTELPFKYVGDGEVWLGNRNPDFININGHKQVIELFGDYWHPKTDVKDRINHYKEYGFTTLIIWEHELYSSPSNVFEKISIFSEMEDV